MHTLYPVNHLIKPPKRVLWDYTLIHLNHNISYEKSQILSVAFHLSATVDSQFINKTQQLIFMPDILEMLMTSCFASSLLFF